MPTPRVTDKKFIQQTRFILVQHHGWVHFHRKHLRNTVEVREVRLLVARQLARQGVAVYEEYRDAVKAAYRANYPDGPTGRLPKVDTAWFFHSEHFDEPVYCGPPLPQERAA